jgi:glycine cleavage system H protein
VGTKIAANAAWGEIESVKATSDLYSGVSGTVTAVNSQLAANPGLVNSDPFGQGWMIKVKVADAGQLAKLLSADQYLKKTGH